jgi:hypothetical protein
MADDAPGGCDMAIGYVAKDQNDRTKPAKHYPGKMVGKHRVGWLSNKYLKSSKVKFIR